MLRVLGRTAVTGSAIALGLGCLLLAIELPQLGIRSAHWRVKLAFIGTFLLVLIVPVALNAPSRASVWGRLWEGRLGRWWFALAGVGARGGSGR
jgi:hypothetical protein